jgi:hypothetical protein
MLLAIPPSSQKQKISRRAIDEESSYTTPSAGTACNGEKEDNDGRRGWRRRFRAQTLI